MPDRPSPAVLEVLEKCWVSESTHDMPTQFPRGGAEVDGLHVAKRVADAYEAGLIRRWDKHLHGRFPMLIKGFALTHAGRIAYCQWASEQGGGNV